MAGGTILHLNRWRPPDKTRTAAPAGNRNGGKRAYQLTAAATYSTPAQRTRAPQSQPVLRLRHCVLPPRSGGPGWRPGWSLEVNDPEIGVIICGHFRRRDTAEQEAARFAAMRGWEFRP